MLFRRLWPLCLIMTLLIVHPILAQGGSVLSYGQTVQGNITKNAIRILYTFQGRKDDVIDVTMSRLDGNLDPLLILSDSRNTLISLDDDGGVSGYDARLQSVQLPRDDIYFIVATRFGQDKGLTTGNFALTLSRVGLSAANDAGTILQYGDNVVLQIDDAHHQRIFAFAATRGDVLTMKMQRISGDLDSLLILADSQGNVIAVNDDDPATPGTLDAALNGFLIQRTANYVLIATRFGRQAGTSSGGFSLTLSRFQPDLMGKIPDKAILLDPGIVVTGSIDSTTVTRYYMFDVQRGQVVTIEATRTDGTLDPTLTLYSADMQRKLATNDSGVRGRSARITAYPVTVNGTLILAVSRFNGDTGTTSGAYTLNMTVRSAVALPKK